MNEEDDGGMQWYAEAGIYELTESLKGKEHECNNFDHRGKWHRKNNKPAQIRPSAYAIDSINRQAPPF